MTFKQAIREHFIQGFSGVDISVSEIVITMAVAFALALYLYLIYRLLTANAFYSKSFNISMAAISLVTCGIIIAMQSSLVISLGMVGALSIVRFRTAIKEPMDLLFLFWSIGTGIICGTGLYKIAIAVALCVTVAILLLRLIPESRGSNILFLSSMDPDAEKKLEEILTANTLYRRVKSRNMTAAGVDLVFEVKTKDAQALLKAISAADGTTNVSLIEHEGEFRG